MIAAFSGPTPKILIIRLRLYARTWRLISVRTLSRVRVRKWVGPIQALRVPNGCSTVCRRTPMASGIRSSRSCILHPVEHILILPALDAPQLGRRALGSERASEAGAQVAVEVEVFGVIRPAIGLGEFGACRAGVMVLLGVVDEVLRVKKPRLAPLDVRVWGTIGATPVPSRDRIWS